MRAFGGKSKSKDGPAKKRLKAEVVSAADSRRFQLSSYVTDGQFIQRKPICACGGGCPACQANSGDLKISQPNDAAEIEADQIADRVMRMSVGESAGKINGAKSVATSDAWRNSIHRKCDRCEDAEEQTTEMAVMRKEAFASAAATPPPADTPPSIKNVINSGGQPLDSQTRKFFEPRLGYDLGSIRIHTGSTAGESARAIDARAYTLGNNIVLGNGEYKPESESGKRLLAHELAHVVQQSGTSQNSTGGIRVERKLDVPTIQRACGTASIAAALRSSGAPDCVGLSGDVSGERFRFRINCDDFASTAEEASFNRFLAGIEAGDFFKVHGFASIDGDMSYNLDLACARARKAATMIARAGGVVTDVISFGPTAGVAADRRSVVITPTLIPGGAASVPCPHGIADVNVAMFLLPGSTRDIFADLAFANRVFADCCVRFVSTQGGSLSVPGWTDHVLDHSDNCSDLSLEEQEMFDAAAAQASGADVWIFFVENYNPDTVGSKGLSCHVGLLGGGHALFPPSVYIKNGADPGTLAHELGHILLVHDDVHSGLVDPSDPNNLMQVREAGGQRVTLDTTQCSIIFSNA
ncbi:MAG: DUF4157 domain-containing protein [Pyrinomonadaceae bacterium]